MKANSALSLLFLPLAVSACATSVYQAGEPIVAPEGEAIGGLVVETAIDVHNLVFTSVDNSRQLFIPQNPVGVTQQVFHAPPGRYCLTSVRTGAVVFRFNISRLRKSCFNLSLDNPRFFGRMTLDDKWKFGGVYNQEDEENFNAKFNIKLSAHPLTSLDGV